MVSVRHMYCRPGNLFKDFIIENNKQVVTRTGRVADHPVGSGADMLRGCLAEASDEDRMNHSQKDHIVTHTIVQAGKPKAKREDHLILGKRVFYIVDIDDVGMLEFSTIYYAEERKGIK